MIIVVSVTKLKVWGATTVYLHVVSNVKSTVVMTNAIICDPQRDNR